ncbi:MAG: relaxase domain-containing protein [Patescibacteria group bacterium]
MLRINVIQNTSQAIQYYETHYSKDDYYAKDQIESPNLQGKLANKLGLTGDISMKAYGEIMEGKLNGGNLTQHSKTNRSVTPLIRQSSLHQGC